MARQPGTTRAAGRTPAARTPRKPRTPRSPRAAPTPRRSHAGRIAAALIGVASAAGVGYGLNHTEVPKAVVARILPDAAVTPGAIDPAVTDANICAHDWLKGAPPTQAQGGVQTYSQAARSTSQAVKEQAFANYGIGDPHDGGASYEVDHRVPLSLGGRDLIKNLWPQSRTAQGMNAWTKDRLEDRLYRLLCHPKPGEVRVTLKDAQAAMLGDWTEAYQAYCADGSCDAAPAGSGGGE